MLIPDSSRWFGPARDGPVPLQAQHLGVEHPLEGEPLPNNPQPIPWQKSPAVRGQGRGDPNPPRRASSATALHVLID